MATRTTLSTPDGPGSMVSVSLSVEGIPTRAQVIEAIASGAKLYFEGDEVATSILPGILASAERPVDVFAASELDKPEDHYGETLTILSVDAVRNSDFEGGLGIYLVVTATNADGELLRLGVGSTDAIGKLVVLHEMGAFPWKVAFERSAKATKAGFYPVNLVSRQPIEGTALRAGESSF